MTVSKAASLLAAELRETLGTTQGPGGAGQQGCLGVSLGVRTHSCPEKLQSQSLWASCGLGVRRGLFPHRMSLSAVAGLTATSGIPRGVYGHL